MFEFYVFLVLFFSFSYPFIPISVSYMILTMQIYIKICTTKFSIVFFEMGVVYEEEIVYISSRIRELRKERHLTVQELAYRCDMERSNLSRIEAGRTNLTIRTICIICSALEVGLRDIIR